MRYRNIVQRGSGILIFLWMAMMGMALIPVSSRAVSRLQFEREIGGKGAGPGQFGEEIYVAFDREGRLYVSDSDHRRVQRLSTSGFEVLSGEGVAFRHPKDLVVDDQGRIYVVDWHSVYVEGSNNPKLYTFLPCIHVLDPEGKLIRTISLGPKEKPRGLQEATVIVDEEGAYALGIKATGYDRDFRLAMDRQRNLYVLDVSTNTISKFDPEGTPLFTFGSYGAGNGQLDGAQDLTVDHLGYVYVADTGNHRVVVFNPEGDFDRTFGRKGLRSGEFVEPFSIVMDRRGRILVADRGMFERKFEDHPFRAQHGRVESDWLMEALLAEEESDKLMALRRELEELQYSLIEMGPVRELVALQRRVEELEEATGKEKEEEEVPPEKYLKVVQRIQVFDRSGNILGKVIFSVDKNDRELRDLELLAMDAREGVYLRDPSRYTVRRYRMDDPMFPRWGDMERAYGARVTREEDLFKEDFGDVDPLIDEKSERKRLRAQQAFSFNYDFSERLNLSFKDLHQYSQRDDKELDLDKPQNDSAIDEAGYDNSFGINLRYVLDPNLYRYREANLYAKRLDGYTTYERTAPNSKERSDRQGDASAILVGSDVDLFRDVNVAVGYSRFEPPQAQRNYDTFLYDDLGRLYRVNRHFSRKSVLVGELKIKF